MNTATIALPAKFLNNIGDYANGIDVIDGPNESDLVTVTIDEAQRRRLMAITRMGLGGYYLEEDMRVVYKSARGRLLAAAKKTKAAPTSTGLSHYENLMRPFFG